MPFVFAYGTLQQDDVQQATFGRLLEGRRDALVGFELTVARVNARLSHANVIRNGRPDSRVSGMVFELTDAELAVADRYEKPADYVRVAVMLASGDRAWVYVHAPSVARDERATE